MKHQRKQERPTWCPHLDCQYLRSSQSVICAGQLQAERTRRDIERKQLADEIEKIVWSVNSDERHTYPDPCLVCESNDRIIAIVERLREVRDSGSTSNSDLCQSENDTQSSPE